MRICIVAIMLVSSLGLSMNQEIVDQDLEQHGTSEECQQDDFKRDYPRLILVRQTNHEVCLNHPANCYEGLKSVKPNISALVSKGAVLGLIAWCGLAIKDHYYGVILSGGAEFNALSIPGFLVVVVPITATVTAIAYCSR